MICILVFNPCNNPKKVGKINTILILQLKNVKLRGQLSGLLKITRQEQNRTSFKTQVPSLLVHYLL